MRRKDGRHVELARAREDEADADEPLVKVTNDVRAGAQRDVLCASTVRRPTERCTR